jgi:hypothetical protein
MAKHRWSICFVVSLKHVWSARPAIGARTYMGPGTRDTDSQCHDIIHEFMLNI